MKLIKLLFVPVSIISGVLAGLIAKKGFDGAWGLVDDQEAPGPEHEESPVGKLALALVLQGAIFALVRGLVERGTRRSFQKVVGVWPGEKRPDPK